MALTQSQQAAVQARGNVIVVAGAGTGKTSTLVERCVALLAGGCSLENILMVTFTEAAAAEMRHRLRLALAVKAGEPVAASEPSLWWQEQMALLDSARICTLHSFCLQLIRENFHLLGIDPAVKVLDEHQVQPLMETALDACIDPHLGGEDARSMAIRELIQVYGRGDTDVVRALVVKLHLYARSLESPDRWFRSGLDAFAREDPDDWRYWLRAGVVEWAALWLPELEAAADSAENLARCCRALHAVGTPAEESGSVEGQAVAAALMEIQLADEASWPKGKKTVLRKPFEKFFAEAGFLASQFESVNGVEGLAADWAAVRGPLQALLRLTAEFGETFAEAKRDSGGMDFADLEQFTLRLLWDEQGQLAAVARQCQAALAHVFVDECQDLNAAQDAILRAVSRGGMAPDRPDAAETGNRFLVGDVKQSIYQFRLARPSLFLGYERQWQEGRQGQRILLSDNFRSRRPIIHFVNALFEPLMRENVGGVEYLPLNAGRLPEDAADASHAAPTVEFHLIPKTNARESHAEEGDNGERRDSLAAVDDLLTIEKEARLVAIRLTELHRSGLQVWDKEFDRLRRVEWRDMAILLRSPSHRVEAFAQEFHRFGVPLQAARGGFLESTEVTDLLSLLRLLDNPLQDIPLLAVLRSPLVAMSLDELAEVRIASRERRFWMAVQAFHRAKPGEDASALARSGWDKVDAFLGRFGVWRELLRQTSLSQCLERALMETDYEAILQAGERGAERVANVRRLIRLVREYDPYQRQGLFRFLRYVDALIEAGQDLEPAPAQTRNAVRLMSIHQSKGLEFPVVVVACLGGLFNLGDLNQDVLLDEDFGLCAKAVVPGGGARYPTLAHWLAARRQRRQCLGEELRLLYVAATRARDRLFFTATANRRDAEAWEGTLPRPFSSRELLSARSPLDWMLLWLPTVTATGDWGEEGGQNALLSWRIWGEAENFLATEATPTETVPKQAVASPEPGTRDAVVHRIRWRYEHASSTHEPAKTSVTALRRKSAELIDEDAAHWVSGPRPASRPSGGDGLGAATIGTLHHQFLQRMELAGAVDQAGLQAQLSAMTQRGDFSPEAAVVLDLEGIARFWSGAVGQGILARRSGVLREVPFTARFSPTELAVLGGVSMAGNGADEFVVVQGVADLLVVLEAELWLLDFKTDDVGADGLEAKAALYRPQLRLYAAALSGIYGRPVTQRWLHFLRARQTVVV